MGRRSWGTSIATAGVLLLGLSSTGATFAAEPVYTIANYPIEATADNAVAAKERALADGRQAALRSLLKRIVPAAAYARLERVKSA